MRGGLNAGAAGGYMTDSIGVRAADLMNEVNSDDLVNDAGTSTDCPATRSRVSSMSESRTV